MGCNGDPVMFRGVIFAAKVELALGVSLPCLWIPWGSAGGEEGRMT